MKVFITWSGEKSRELGEILRHWLPSVLQAVKPYFSPDDVTKGSIWFSEIAGELSDAKYGIICVTPENTERPWLNFEAGALSKGLGKPNVCPILFGLAQTDFKGPLSHFQSARFEKSEIRAVVDAMNSLLADQKLQNEVLSSVFEKWWPDLDRQVGDVMKRESSSEGRLRTERDLLEEILGIVRSRSDESKNTLERDRLQQMLADRAKRSMYDEAERTLVMRTLRELLSSDMWRLVKRPEPLSGDSSRNSGNVDKIDL